MSSLIFFNIQLLYIILYGILNHEQKYETQRFTTFFSQQLNNKGNQS